MQDKMVFQPSEVLLFGGAVENPQCWPRNNKASQWYKLVKLFVNNSATCIRAVRLLLFTILYKEKKS